MLNMILKMSALTALYVLLTVLIWRITRNRKLPLSAYIAIGAVYGLCSVLSTHFGVDYGDMLLNVRDMGPLSAGLFFHPISGVIAGLIGGIERYIAGTRWGIGSFTSVACSVSTCLAGFWTVFMYYFIFKQKRPLPAYAFFIGAVMEVFHMYAVIITHRNDMNMAYYVVKNCSAPMILFTGIGMAASSIALMLCEGKWANPFKKRLKEETNLSQRFQYWLFAVIMVISLINYLVSFMVQTQSAVQDARSTLTDSAAEIRTGWAHIQDLQSAIPAESAGPSDLTTGLSEALSSKRVGRTGTYDLIDEEGSIISGWHKETGISDTDLAVLREQADGSFFDAAFFGSEALYRKDVLDDGLILLTMLPKDEIYANRDAASLETAFSDILLVTSIYILISFLVQQIVVNNLTLVNKSLNKITNGDLNEVVTVRNSSEFAILSDDINQTVDVLKGYIDAAEKRMEQELSYARTIQESALPRNFIFPREDFEIYALMDPAKEVGGDFYDFFFVDKNKIAMVIADVSGKGIPASLFMMRSKTTIRNLAESGLSPSEVLFRANNTLCDGNDADIFVSVWIGIADLGTGVMECANAGHEYPILKQGSGGYELLKDKHSLVLAAMPNLRTKEYKICFEPGDKLFVYTDGVPEAINPQTEAYGLECLLNILNEAADKNPSETLSAVRKDLSSFVGSAEQFDDITMLGFQYNGNDQI